MASEVVSQDLVNAKLDIRHIAELGSVNAGAALTATDRLGQTKKTWKGLEVELNEAYAATAVGAIRTQYEDCVYPGVYVTPPTNKPRSGAPSADGDRCTILTGEGPFEHIRLGGAWAIANFDAQQLAQVATVPMMGYSADEAQSIFDNALPLTDFTELRDYAGHARSIRITGLAGLAQQDGIAGPFFRADADTTTPDNGGWVIVDALNRRWKRPNRQRVQLEHFGAKPSGGYMGSNFGDLPAEPRHDCSDPFRRAIAWCLATKRSLYVGEGCWYFEADRYEFEIYGVMDLIGVTGHTQFAVNYTLCASPKTAEFLRVSGNAGGKLKDFRVRSSSYLGRGIVLNDIAGDNQKLVLDSVFVDTHRYGLYSERPECFNQISTFGCSFTANYFAGIKLNSFTPPAGYAHSGPLNFHSTICNGNGPTAFAMGATYTAGPGPAIAIKDTDYDIGVQLWLRGFVNALWLGGQLSGHGSPRTQGLAVLQQGTSFQFVGPDVEDIGEGTAYTADGQVAITSGNLDLIESSYENDVSGAAIVVSGVNNFSIDSPHMFGIGTLATIKLIGVANASIGAITRDAALRYSVWEASNAIDNPSQHYIHPSLVGSVKGINAVAFENLGYRPAALSILHHEIAPAQGISPNTGVNAPHSTVMWQNGEMANSADLNEGWALNFLATAASPLGSGHLWNEIAVSQFGDQAVSHPTEFRHIYLQVAHAGAGDGRVVIQACDAAGAVLAAQWWSADKFVSNFPMGGTVRFTPPSGTKKIRYGMVNSANYRGNLRAHFAGGYGRSPRFFLRVLGIQTDIGRYGFFEPPYTAAKDTFRVGA